LGTAQAFPLEETCLAGRRVSLQVTDMSSACQIPVRCRTEKEETSMNRFTLWAGSMLGALLLAGAVVQDAAAVELTGTWSGTAAATCHGLVAGTVPASGKIDITLKISPATTGLNVCVTLARTDLTATFNGAHQYHGTLFAKSEKSNTAYGTLTQSDTAVSAGDLTGAVGSLTSSLNKTDKILRLKGVLVSGDETTAMSCTFKELTRTDTADPGAACP
jgi:hypothetical protein